MALKNIQIAITLLLALASGWAQGVQGTAKARRVEIVNNQLGIAITGIGSKTEWVLAIRADDAQTPQIVTEGAVLGAPDPFGHPLLLKLFEYPADSVALSPGNINIDLGSQSGVIYAVVPSGTRVRCTANGNAVTDTIVVQSLLVRSGVVVNEPVLGLQTALARLLTPVRKTPAPITSLPNGRLVASIEELKRHVLTKSQPAQLASSGKARVVNFIVTIGPTGSVAKVVQATGDEADVAPLRQSILAWKFAPFLQNGHAIEVDAAIQFMITEDGLVVSGV
jgi:hypothetical protein